MLSLVEITAFRLEGKLPPMRALEFIRDHVTFKLPYDISYHMKTPDVTDRYRVISIKEKSQLANSPKAVTK